MLAEETGYALLPAPWSPVALAGPLLDDELRGRRSAQATGQRTWPRPSQASWTMVERPHAAPSRRLATRLTGSKVTVPDLASVTDVVVVATDGLYASTWPPTRCRPPAVDDGQDPPARRVAVGCAHCGRHSLPSIVVSQFPRCKD